MAKHKLYFTYFLLLFVCAIFIFILPNNYKWIPVITWVIFGFVLNFVIAFVRGNNVTNILLSKHRKFLTEKNIYIFETSYKQSVDLKTLLKTEDIKSNLPIQLIVKIELIVEQSKTIFLAFVFFVVLILLVIITL